MNEWKINKLIRLFNIKVTKTQIYRDELNGLIPLAKRKNNIRYWDTNSLPMIGEKYGKFKKPNKRKIISVYTPKGGVLKTTLSLNIARFLAIHNIKVLVIGLDVQGSITANLEQEETNLLSEIKEYQGLYEAIISDKPIIHNIIKGTDLASLSFIPESSSLNLLEQRIRDMPAREFYIYRKIEEEISDFNVIIFDNSPNWNFLIQNSLTCATDVISPIGCDIESYRSLSKNIEMVNDFKREMRLKWNNFILIPTKRKRNNLSSQIESQYRSSFPEICSSESIRCTVKGEESSFDKLSAIEYDVSSHVANDYVNVITELWKKVNSI